MTCSSLAAAPHEHLAAFVKADHGRREGRAENIGDEMRAVVAKMGGGGIGGT